MSPENTIVKNEINRKTLISHLHTNYEKIVMRENTDFLKCYNYYSKNINTV